MTTFAASQPYFSAPNPAIRVALVEDDPIQRLEIIRLLRSESTLELVGIWEAFTELVAKALRAAAPDVVLADIGLPGKSGIALVQHLKPELPRTQFMMLTVCEDTDRIFNALAAGATGYLLKKDAPAQLPAAIYELHAGGSPMSSAIARQVVTRFQLSTQKSKQKMPASSLSPREQEVLRQLAQGRLYKEIAENLGLGIGTVRTHVRRIYEKLHAHNRTQAIRFATGS